MNEFDSEEAELLDAERYNECVFQDVNVDVDVDPALLSQSSEYLSCIHVFICYLDVADED